ncbi:hypothetical protein QA584_06320 [Anaerocolumna sp. AGMB13025]|uniref:hypothetical protein n=1 Tax=Anaerocolumna sp. AGMB13025 TaxID=3039116 RepID=UPI00241FFDC9|nr:hypothetical protein [Anaerocolumna sp. AGMB13025]WFR58688.1 hypothetical protein QA584_06320 [Anaerocolumna sp. AGMB13025]
MKLSKLDYVCIRNWMYRNARPLDLARWQYHFENGEKNRVLEVLAAYQNDDGGFGHALEEDSWNVDSAPIQTGTAIQILSEIGYSDKSHPIIQGILNYLDMGKDYKEGYWLSEVPSNNQYPHAPWWTFGESEPVSANYNPTAMFLGFILYFGDKKSSLYQNTRKAAAHMMEKVSVLPLNNMHEIMCFLIYLDYLKKTDVILEGSQVFAEKIRQAVHTTINPKTEEWADTYACKPSNMFDTPDSAYYVDNKQLADYQCQFLINSRNSAGVWNITWDWGGNYEKEFAIAENWWKGELVIKNMLYLRNFRCIEL